MIFSYLDSLAIALNLLYKLCVEMTPALISLCRATRFINFFMLFSVAVLVGEMLLISCSTSSKNPLTFGGGGGGDGDGRDGDGGGGGERISNSLSEDVSSKFIGMSSSSVVSTRLITSDDDAMRSENIDDFRAKPVGNPTVLVSSGRNPGNAK